MFRRAFGYHAYPSSCLPSSIGAHQDSHSHRDIQNPGDSFECGQHSRFTVNRHDIAVADGAEGNQAEVQQFAGTERSSGIVVQNCAGIEGVNCAVESQPMKPQQQVDADRRVEV